MAQLINVKLSRFDASPWGFRLQGGKDFGQPLVIQKVNGNSIAEKAGLQAGDALIKVNNVELFNLNHKDAQNAIVRAGNNYELIVQRGGSTWKPSVTPVGPSPSVGNVQPVTKTSLAYKQPPAPQPNAYNLAPRPFGGSQVNGETIKSITSKQYNTPVGLYSEETIAETLSAQAEVLAGGVLGVNFKKNEKTYNAANSEVLKMVQEIDKEPREQEPADIAPQQIAAPTTPKVSNVPVSNPLSGLRHVSAPEPRPQPAQDPFKVLPPGQNICADCERLIVGLFVRIKDKNLHVECFKCATCGTSLKNVGYYNINNKLYCDVHAKLVARQNPPAPNLEPITVSPGGKIPSSVIASSIAAAPAPFQSQFSTPSAAAAPGSPQPGTLAPLPFHAPYLGIRHVNAPRSYFYPHKTPTSSIQSPKVNLNQPAVPSPLARPTSDVVQEGNIQYQSYSTLSQSSFEAKSENVRFEQSTEAKSEFRSEEKSSLVQSSETAAATQKKMSICSQEIGKMHMDAQSMVKHLQEILEDQDHQDRCPSPTPLDEAMKLASQEAERAQAEVQRISEEAIQKVEQEKQWANYQAEGKEIVNQHLQKVKETGVAFLRSHSTPVSELEALYEQQQNEIESQKQRIISLGSAKENEVNEDKKKEIEELIIASQKQIIESQEKQKEIERKKHVRFQEEAEVKRRESLQVQQLEFEDTRRIREAQQIEQEQRRRYEEAQKRSVEEKQQLQDLNPNRLFGLEALRESARTPVATLEAYEREDNMSQKTEKIFHTYEQLIQSEDDIQAELAVKPETPKPLPPIRPLTPAGRIGSPFPGSIPLAEKSLLLKNIQGIQFEFDQANPKKPEPKKFKLPDLRNLGKAKPLTFAQTPSAAPSVPAGPKPEPVVEKKTEVEQVELQQRQQAELQQRQQAELQRQQAELQQRQQAELQRQQAELQQRQQAEQQQRQQAELQQRQQAEFQQKQQLIQQQLKEVEETRKQAEFQEQQLLLQNQYLEQNVIDQRKYQIQQEKLQHQQIKEQRKQVHEELAQNEKFRRKQETLGPPKSFERSKTPVAELEEQERQRAQSERTKQIYSSYDQVIQQEERPRSIVGQPLPEAQTLTEAEKSLFFQNIQGINYEFENITQLSATKHLAEHEKSQFIKSVENRTKSPITVGVNTYTKVPAELTQQPIVQPKPDIYQSAFVDALTTMPDAAARQLTSQKSYEEYKEEQERLYQQQKLEQQKYYEQQRQLQLQKQMAIPKDLVSALTIAPDRPYSPLPSAPAMIPQKVPLPEQTAPYAPSGETKSLIDALTIAPEKPFAPQVFDAGSIDSAILNTERRVETAASSQRRQSAGFPGINVQRTPYQMLKGAQIKTTFEEELKTQESALTQFLAKKEESSQSTTTVESSIRQEYQSFSQESSSSTFQASIAPGFGLVPSSPQIAYAPPPPIEKRAELAASQAKFGPQVEIKPEKPKQEAKPLSRPMTMIEALMIAPDRAYSPFPEASKPQATLVCGGAAVALTKGDAVYESQLLQQQQQQQQQLSQSHIEVKPIYQVRDVQLSKDKVGSTGISEERKEKQQEAGIIQGEGITGAYQKSEEKYESVQQFSVVIENQKNGTDEITKKTADLLLNDELAKCWKCDTKGPFITALGKIWCPDHFVCTNAQCRRPLADIGFVEEEGQGLYCEFCFEKYIAPSCDKCSKKIKGDCLNAIGKHFHPECFNCAYCGKLFGNSPFFLEDGLPYCEADWNELFTTKCFACGFPIEAGDRWVEALNNNYHSQCFNCTMCKTNLEGQSFYAKGGRPFCKAHAR